MSLHNETCLSAISGKQNKELILDYGGLVWEGGLLEPESASLMRQFYSNINLRAPRSAPGPRHTVCVNCIFSELFLIELFLIGFVREKQQRKLRKFQPAAGLTDKVECGGAVVDLDVDVAEIPAVHAINALRGGQGEQETRASHEMDKGDAAEYDWTFTGVEGEEDELLVMATKVHLAHSIAAHFLCPGKAFIFTHVFADGKVVQQIGRGGRHRRVQFNRR